MTIESSTDPRPASPGADDRSRWALHCYVAFSFLSMFLVGAGLVIVSWIAIAHHSIALVGQLYFAASFTNISFSMVGGVLVDRQNRRTVILRAQALRLLAACVLLLGLLDERWLTAALFAFTILGALGPALSVGAMGGAFQSFFAADQRMKIVLRLAIVGQAGLVVGTGIAGVLLHLSGAAVSVAILIALSAILLMLGAYFTGGMGQPQCRAASSFGADWRDALRYMRGRRQICALMACVALLFSVAQMTNTLVPGFVRDTLNAGSDVFGLLEAAWATGGGTILLVSAALQRRAYSSWLEFLLLAVLGMTMVAFALCQAIGLSVVLYAVMGGLFSLSRALCTGRLLVLTDPARIGRTQALTSMLTSCLGMLIYMLPTLVTIDDIAFYYQVWGIAIAGLGLGLAALSWRASWGTSRGTLAGTHPADEPPMTTAARGTRR